MTVTAEHEGDERVATPEPGSPVIGLGADTVGSESFAGEMIRGCIAAAAEHGVPVGRASSGTSL